MKPWYQCSESWITIITSLTGIAVVVGAITTEQADQIKNATQQLIGALMSLIPVITYVKSRTDLKKTVVDNMPDVEPADPTMKIAEAAAPKTAHDRYGEALRKAGV